MHYHSFELNIPTFESSKGCKRKSNKPSERIDLTWMASETKWEENSIHSLKINLLGMPYLSAVSPNEILHVWSYFILLLQFPFQIKQLRSWSLTYSIEEMRLRENEISILRYKFWITWIITCFITKERKKQQEDKNRFRKKHNNFGSPRNQTKTCSKIMKSLKNWLSNLFYKNISNIF